MIQGTHKGLEVYRFENPDLWLNWLEKSFDRPESIWLKLAKKSCDVATVN